jgi:cell division protein FtsQ
VELSLNTFVRWTNKVLLYFIFNIVIFGLLIVGCIYYLNKFQQHYPFTRLQLLCTPNYVATKELELSFANLLNKNLWLININEVKKLAYSDPWVEFAFVQKQWPDLLQVQIVQHNPIAVWNDKFFLTANGKILCSTKENHDNVISFNLPKFYGPLGKEKDMLAAYQVLLEKLTPLDLKVNQVKFTAGQGIQITLNNKVLLNLGTFDLSDRIARFMIAYKKKLKTMFSDIFYVDLRYNNGVAVFFKASGFPEQ